MNYIRGGVIVLPDRLISGHVLAYDDKICGIFPEGDGYADAMNAAGCYIAPGFIDLHIHGYGGCDASDGDVDGILKMARVLLENGVTAFYPTLMTLSPEKLNCAVSGIRSAMRDARGCARILGAHLEGPLLNPARAGAQDPDEMSPLPAEYIRENRDIIRIITLAPEMPGAADVIREFSGELLLSAGHSDAAFAEASSAFSRGVRHVTHLFNAMSGIHHRNPGLAAAALSDGRVSCELIADGHHVSTELFSMIRRMKGDKLVLVTDCTRAGGMEEGEYLLGGQIFRLSGGKCLLPDGTLAGSVLRMNDAVRNLVKSGAPVPEAVFAASLAPARAVGLDGERGSITIGKCSDLVLLDPDFRVRKTIIGGKITYQA